MAIDWEKVNSKKLEIDNKATDFGDRPKIFWWKPKVGDNTVRLMPGWAVEGEFAGQFWREVVQHWNITPDQGAPIICTEHTPGLTGICKICAVNSKLKSNKGSLAAQTRLGDTRGQKSYLFNIVDRDDPEWTARDVAQWSKENADKPCPFEAGGAKVQVYAAGAMVFDQIITQMSANHLDLSDPKDGRDIVIGRTGKGRNTRYKVTVIIQASEAPEFGELTPLDTVGYTMSENEQLSLLAESDLPALVASSKTSESLPELQMSEDATPVAALGEDEDLAARLRAQISG